MITNLKESQLLTDNIGIIDRPAIVTDGAPSLVYTDLHTTL